MAKNPYFLDNTSEQKLIENLTQETIYAMGNDVYYIPRKLFHKDYLFGEDPVAKFKGSYKIEMYINSVSGFEGQGDIISKFGIELKDRVELVVSKKRFNELVSAIDAEIQRPREGDLIYFPLSDTLFEINFVEHENPFYPLGKLYTYVLTCEAFTYSHEEFDTDQSFIDDIKDEKSTRGFELYMNTATDFIVGETVFHIIGNGETGPTPVLTSNADGVAQVVTWNTTNDKNLLIVGNHVGSFNIEAGEYIYGVSSGARGEITSYGNLDLVIPKSREKNDDLLDNTDLEREKNDSDIFDFTDKDPFSEGNY